MGFSGIINFPSVGYIDGRWRDSLEATGFGYDREVDMIRKAAARGMFTLAYVYEPHEAPAMAEAGVDIIVAHMGLTTGGSIGAGLSFTKSLDDCIEQGVRTKEAALAVNPEVLVLCHGGPLELPEDVQVVMRGSGCQGFIGASTMERLPIETAIEDTVRAFKDIELAC